MPPARYEDVVPASLRELAKRYGLPTPNRYVPSPEEGPLLAEQDLAGFAELEELAEADFS